MEYNEKTEEVREPEVNNVMNKLNKAVEGLSQSVEQIEARLLVVVRNDGSRAEKPQGVDSPQYGTKLAQDINIVKSNILSLQDRLGSLLDRLEI